MRRVRLETEYGLEMTKELELGSSSSCSWRRLCQQGSGEQGLKGGAQSYPADASEAQENEECECKCKAAQATKLKLPGCDQGSKGWK